MEEGLGASIRDVVNFQSLIKSHLDSDFSVLIHYLCCDVFEARQLGWSFVDGEVVSLLNQLVT